MKIDAGKGIDPEEMRTGLAEAVERAEWVVSENSPIQVTATIIRGKNRNSRSARSGSPSSSRASVPA